MIKSPYSNIPYINQLYNVAYNLNSNVDIHSCAQIAPLPENSSTVKYSYWEAHIGIITPDGQQQIDDAYTSGQISLTTGGTYSIKYYGRTEKQVRISYNESVTTREEFSFTFAFSVVQNRLPLKKWTVTEVLNRLFDLAEPLHKGEKPRFRLQGVNDDGTYAAGSQAEQFDKIPSPEFSFTKQTLRECLKQVGGFIHGEPRLTPKKDGAGTWYYEVSYDMYGATRQWMHANRRYVENTHAENMAQFATALDTNPENLINKLKDYTGVTVEPYAGGKKSVRTEQMYVQITESNMLIATQRPIYTVEELEYVADDGTTTRLTPYLFEASVYNSQLSSYDGQYPYSKAYGLMYTQGERNITALDFKQEDPISPVFKNYAIVNILREAMGDSGFTPPDYALLCFRVTYTPIYNARVKQVKPNYKEYAATATQIYNQSSNLIESRAFGENLKGVIARMGNPEISHTYVLGRLVQIPHAGMKFDEDYYISGVYTEILPTYIRCTVALTRDFNRISEYIGIPQYKRYSQISQTMAVDRNIVYEEFVVIGDREEPDEDSLIGIGFISSLAHTFSQTSEHLPITSVLAYGGSYQDSENRDSGFNVVSLPVVAAAYGNSVSFSWEYADNYSAGSVSTYKTNGEVRGYFQSDFPYSDYFGRMYYYNFDLKETPPRPTSSAEAAQLPLALPGGVEYGASENCLSTFEKAPYIIRKDAREKLQVNLQVHFVTNRKGLIIGSALASYCCAIRGSSPRFPARLYVLPAEIDKFSENLLAQGIDLSALPSTVVRVSPAYSGYFYIDGSFPNAEGVAWAIVTMPHAGEAEQVENEQGIVSTVSQMLGGDLLLGCNVPVKDGEELLPGGQLPSIYFTKKRNVYPRAAWIDRR